MARCLSSTMAHYTGVAPDAHFCSFHSTSVVLGLYRTIFWSLTPHWDPLRNFFFLTWEGTFCQTTNHFCVLWSKGLQVKHNHMKPMLNVRWRCRNQCYILIAYLDEITVKALWVSWSFPFISARQWYYCHVIMGLCIVCYPYWKQYSVKWKRK